MSKINVKDIVLIAIFAAITFVLEYVLQFLPNVQVTVLLLVLFSKKLGTFKTSLIILIYVLLDTFLGVGGFSIYYFPAMLIGWLIIPITLNTIFKKINEPLYLAFLGIIYSFVYCLLFAVPAVLLTEVKLLDYLTADFIFALIFAISSFLSILWLYKPLEKFLKNIYKG